MRRFGRGFTLPELMIVVAIVAILATIAFQVYPQYTKRTKMSEVVLAISACRTPVAEVYQTQSNGPGAGNWGCEISSSAGTRYMQQMSTDVDGKIIVTARGFNDTDIDNKTLTLVPLMGGVPAASATDMGKRITAWRCGSPTDGTTIPLKYLPGSCRGS